MKTIKIFITIIFTLLLPLNVFATTNTTDRNTLDNLGVNKKWQITDENRDNVLNTKKVDASEKIYDFSDILTDEEEEQLYNKIKAFIEKTNMDFVFISDRLEYTYDSKNEEYAADFYDYNDFGIDFEKYSGIVLFRNTYEEDRYYDMYLFGNSQLYFDYDRRDEILDAIYNYFVNDDYLTGINTFLTYCNTYYDNGIPSDLEGYYVDEDGYLHQDPSYVKPKPPYKAPIFQILVADVLITLITLLILIKKNKMVKNNLKTMDYLDKKSVKFTKSTETFVRSYTTSHTRETHTSGSHHSSSGHSYSSSRGSSGGGHSSGGGRHG